MSQSTTAISGGSSTGGETNVLMRLLRQGHSFSGRERNCCFLNTAGGPFADVSAATGWDFPDDGRAIARTDWNLDGALDFWVQNRSGPQVRLLVNRGAQHNHFLKLRLTGNGLTVNRDAIGARVEVVAAGDEDLRRLQTVRAGDGFLAQSTKWLHFGLGDASRIEKVTIRWPHGDVQDVAEILPDHFYEITQGDPVARRWQPPAQVVLAAEPAMPGQATASLQLVSSLQVPLPSLQYEDFAGETRDVLPPDDTEDANGRFVLMNLWANWCAPCLRELAEFKLREEDLRDVGVEVVALSTDRFGSDGGTAVQAVETVERLGLPFRVGFASEALIDVLQLVHDYVFDRHRQLPVPTSVLIDSQGRLAALYCGSVTVERVLKDADLVSRHLAAEELRDASLPFAGRWLARPTGARIVRIAEALFRDGHFDAGLDYVVTHVEMLRQDPAFEHMISPWSESLLLADRPAQAQLLLRAGLEIYPQMATAHLNLGVALERMEQLDEAEIHYQRALHIDPALVIAHVNLGSLKQQRGDNEGAARALRRAVELDPQLETAHLRLAALLAAQGDLEQSEVELRKATAGRMASAEAHFQLGILLEGQNKLEEAAGAYRTALDVQHDFTKAHVNLGGVLASLGELEEAAAQFGQALELDPDDAKAHLNLGMYYQRQRQPAKALEHLQHAARLEPRMLAAHFHLAGLLWVAGRAEEAVAHYEQVLELDPQHTSTQNNLAWILAVDAEDAIRDGQRAVALAEAAATATKFQHLEVLSSLGAAYAEAGRFDDAVRVTEGMLKQAKKTGHQEAIEQIQQRLLLYRSKRPYRAR